MHRSTGNYGANWLGFGTVPTVDFMRQVNINTSSRRPRTGFVYTATLLTWQAWFLFTEANSGVWEKGGETQTTDETVPRPSGAGQGTALLGFSKLGRSRSRGGVLP